MKLFPFLIFVFIATSLSFAQSNYYVDNNLGSDQPGNGIASGSAAWKSIEYAVDNVVNPTTDSIIIHIAAGVYNLSNNPIDINRYFTKLSLLGDSTNNTIIESESDTSLSNSRVIKIHGANNVSLKYLTIQNGRSSSSGGGIYVDSTGTASIDHCEIIGNIGSANGIGGGIGCQWGNLLITNSTIRDNTGQSLCYGGGIGIVNGNLSIANSTISNNVSSSGGGIAVIAFMGNTIFNMTNSTVSNNFATVGIGGIRFDKYPKDSTVADSFYVSAHINSCTVFNNSCTGTIGIGGIGVWNSDKGDSLYIKNSIVSGNIATVDSAHSDLSGSAISEDYNLIQNAYTSSISGIIAHNIYGVSADCSPLAYNNSLNGTMTCAIASNSPAKDVIPASSPNGAPLYDQRGAARKGNYDIGAYEYWSDSGALPVELVSFTAESSNQQVNLSWKTATEVNNYGFEIERASTSSGAVWKKIGFVKGNGTSTKTNYYSFTDSPQNGKNFNYRLKQIDMTGSYEYSNVINVKIDLPETFNLSQNYPNPFNPSTVIKYSIPASGLINLSVYNSIGQKVATLVQGFENAGIHSVEFKSAGLSSGIYFYRLQENSSVSTKKMILLK